MHLRRDHGQASAELIALITVIAVVLLSASGVAAAAGPTLRNRVTTGFHRALCTVAGQRCVTLDREPCPLLRTDRRSSQEVAIGVLRLGHDRVLLIERRSDGTYLMSLVEGASGGAGLSAGLKVGRFTVAGGELSALAGGRAGRTYTAATPAAARALVAQLRGQRLPAVRALIKETLDLAGLADAEPQVSAYVLAGDGAVDALAKVGLGDVLGGGGEAGAGVELGVRIAAHDREVTAYARLDGRVGVFFDGLSDVTASLKGRRGNAAIGHVTVRNPLALEATSDRVARGSVALRFGPGRTLLSVEVVGQVGDGRRLTEVHARLDPSDPGIAAAIAAWQRHPTDMTALRAVGTAARDSAALDQRSFSMSGQEHELGAEVSLGLALGATAKHSVAASRLTEQRSRPVGGVWEQRLDCAA